MHFSLTSIALAAAALHQASAVELESLANAFEGSAFAGYEQNMVHGVVPIAQKVVVAHPEVVPVFRASKFVHAQKLAWLPRSLGRMFGKREDPVPADATPDPKRPIITPQNVYVLMCDTAGFRGNCLVFGGAPGQCVTFSDFSKDQKFIDQWDNNTESISTNTGGACQFYKFIGCDDHGDDRGVTISYNYNLGEAANGYKGDYEKQITSWRC